MQASGRDGLDTGATATLLARDGASIQAAEERHRTRLESDPPGT